MGRLFNFAGIKRRKAARLFDKAVGLDESQDDEALALYEQVIALDPEEARAYYNMGLIYKYRLDWQRSYELNQKAYSMRPDDQSSRWNLAIAATALGDWVTARQMWTDEGIVLDEGEGPIEADLGPTPVRIYHENQGEVIWADRIDPVRARITSIPRLSFYHYGDTVLHDGAANGYRMLGERELPVFDVLMHDHDGGYRTYRAEITVPKPEDMEALEVQLRENGIECEDWTTSIRYLCRACSEGRPHEQHEHDLEEAETWQHEHELGLALRTPDAANGILSVWQAQGDGRAYRLSLYDHEDGGV